MYIYIYIFGVILQGILSVGISFFKSNTDENLHPRSILIHPQSVMVLLTFKDQFKFY